MHSPRDFVPLGSLLIGVAVAITLNSFVPTQTVIVYPWTLIGIPLIAVGFVQFFWCVSLFTRRKTDLSPGGTPTSLITAGPYRYTRNPIYTANMYVLLGTCVLLGSLLPFIVLPVFFLIVNTFIVPFEERKLISIFGEDYKRYQTRVRRWL